MRDAATLAASYGATATYLPQFGESTFTYSKSYSGTTAAGALTTCTATRTVWYEDPQAFYAKAALVAKYHLGGVAEWTLGMEDPIAIDAIRVVAQSIAPDQVNLAIATTSNSANFGEPVGVTVHAQKRDGTPIPNLPIVITDQIGTATVGSFISDVGGNVHLNLVSAANVSLSATSTASWELAAGIANQTAVSVIPKISVAPNYSVKAGSKFHIHGVISPPAMSSISLAGSLASDASIAKVASDGSFDFTVMAPQPGFYSYTLNTAATSTIAASSFSQTILAR
jgi:hypothetical protein